MATTTPSLISAGIGILRSIRIKKVGLFRPSPLCWNAATTCSPAIAHRRHVQRFLCLSPKSHQRLFANSNHRHRGIITVQNCGEHYYALISVRSFSTPPQQNQSSSSSSLSQQLQDKVQSGKLFFDPCQEKVAKKLTRLQNALKEYDHDEYLRRLEEWDRYEEDTRLFQENMQQQKMQHNEQNPKTIDSMHNDSSTKNIDPPKQPDKLPPVPRGIYLHGPVGTGKSLLLTTLFNTTTTTAPNTKNNNAHNGNHIKKLYIHFHTLLRQIHQRIHQLNLQALRTHGRNFHVDTSKSSNPILRVAEELSREATLLCIDEFQVTDVADAMILSQLFGELWRRGVVVVATSNTIPGRLYEGGVNRGYFMGFLGLLEKYCLVLPLDGVVEDDEENEDRIGHNVDAAQDVAVAKGNGKGNDGMHVKKPKKRHRDYRRIKSGVHGNASQGGKPCGEYYFVMAESNFEQKINDIFRSFCQTDSNKPYITYNNNCSNDNDHDATTTKSLELPVHFSRKICIQPTRYNSNKIVQFTFDELCTTDLGSADYNAIANYFSIIVLRDIPYISLAKPDRARRFITLIDELYEAECCLVCGAVDVPDHLFIGNGNDGEDSDGFESHSDYLDRDERDKNGNMLAVDVAQSQGVPLGQLASVRELSFAFERAKSRLLEMCSEAWWEEKCASSAVVGG